MWSCPSRRRPGGALVTPSRGRPLDLDELIQVQRRSDLLFDGLHALIDVPMPVLGGWELSYCLNYMQKGSSHCSSIDICSSQISPELPTPYSSTDQTSSNGCRQLSPPHAPPCILCFSNPCLTDQTISYLLATVPSIPRTLHIMYGRRVKQTKIS